MHVKPRGQKNPSQHGLESAVRAGIALKLVRSGDGNDLLDHPASHPETHDEMLQFLSSFIFSMSFLK